MEPRDATPLCVDDFAALRQGVAGLSEDVGVNTLVGRPGIGDLLFKDPGASDNMAPQDVTKALNSQIVAWRPAGLVLLAPWALYRFSSMAQWLRIPRVTS